MPDRHCAYPNKCGSASKQPHDQQTKQPRRLGPLMGDTAGDANAPQLCAHTPRTCLAQCGGWENRDPSVTRTAEHETWAKKWSPLRNEAANAQQTKLPTCLKQKRRRWSSQRRAHREATPSRPEATCEMIQTTRVAGRQHLQVFGRMRTTGAFSRRSRC